MTLTGKLKPSAERLLRALRNADTDGLTTLECAEVAGLAYTGRLSEIRDAGYSIYAKRETNSRWRYFLKTTAGLDGAATTPPVRDGGAVEPGGEPEEGTDPDGQLFELPSISAIAHPEAA